MHLARHGGDLAVIIELLRASGLNRSKLARDDYVTMTALFVLATAEVRVAQWSGFTIEAEDAADRDAIARLREHPVLGRDADLLIRLAHDIVTQWQRGKGEGGFFRVSPQHLAGDFAPRPGYPAPEKMMSRDGCRKALQRLDQKGVIDLRQGRGLITWTERGQTCSRIGVITLVRSNDTSIASVIDRFIARADRGDTHVAYALTVYVLHTGMQSVGSERADTGQPVYVLRASVKRAVA
jgi:hypothetical protein